jgi:hypothetical protein
MGASFLYLPAILLLLMLNLAIPPILWAGQVIGAPTRSDYFVLGVTLDSGTTWLPVLANCRMRPCKNAWQSS